MDFIRRCFVPPRGMEPEDIMKVKKFLDLNQDFLNDYIAHQVPASRLEKLLRLQRILNGTSPETASIDTTYDSTSGRSTPNIFKFCKNYGKKGVLDESIPKSDTIVYYDATRVCVSVLQREQPPMGTMKSLNSSQSAPEMMEEIDAEYSSCSPLDPAEKKELCCKMNWLGRGLFNWFPSEPKHIIINQPAASSANGYAGNLLSEMPNAGNGPNNTSAGCEATIMEIMKQRSCGHEFYE